MRGVILWFGWVHHPGDANGCWCQDVRLANGLVIREWVNLNYNDCI